MRIDFKKELNEEQHRAVEQGDGRCLVLAGAGSGKTRTIVYRVAYLLEHGARPDEILLLTFTNKAAREMIERVTKLLGAEVRGMWAGTFHHVANRILRMYGKTIGFSPDFSILDQEDSKDLVRKCMKECGIVSSKETGIPAPAVVQSWISYAANSRKSLRSIILSRAPQVSEYIGRFEQVERAYHEQKRKNNSMDFDDLLNNLLILIRDSSGVLTQTGVQLSQKFRYVLVDEYQDTNVIQADIIDCLSSAHKNLFVVGDDAQSIYSFRAADIRNILSFSNRYPDAKTFKLETNYRSTPEILEIANEIILHNPDQYQKTLVSVLDNHTKPIFVSAMDSGQEAEFITRTIVSLREEGVPSSSIAVLFRASFHSQALEMELARSGITYEYRGGVRFFERAHVKDAIAFCRIFINPFDRLSWQRILSLFGGIGDIAAQKLADHIIELQETNQEKWRENLRQESFFSIVGARAQTGWKDFLRIWNAAINAGENNPSEIISSFIQEGYREYVLREYTDGRERLDDLTQLGVFARQYETLAPLVAEVALQESFTAEWNKNERDNLSYKDKIILSTVHQAKGLEWDTVFIINVAENGFPSGRSVAEGGIAEERRLFYVALTRAQKRLFLTMPVIGGQWGGSQRQSQFIDEIPSNLLDRNTMVPEYADEFGYGNGYSRNTQKKNSWGGYKKKTKQKSGYTTPSKKTSDEISYEKEEEYDLKPGKFLPEVEDL